MMNEKDGLLKVCPKCGKKLKKRIGEFGTYLDCTGYPECKFTYDISKKTNMIFNDKAEMHISDRCPNCNRKLAIYIGKNGAFFGCNGYPQCKFSLNIEDLESIVCPKCGNSMIERSGKYGLFLGCTNYPTCKFTYPIRISKAAKNKIKPEIKSKKIKRLELGELEGNLTRQSILSSFSSDWLDIKQIISKLNIKDENDISYLNLKLKQFERNKILDIKNEKGIKYWKKANNVNKLAKEGDKKRSKPYVYVLKLENNKWWVGRTSNLSKGIAIHEEGQGSSWTRENKVLSTEEVIEDGDLIKITLKYMKKYGWQNIRGTCFNDSYYVYIPKELKLYIKSQEGGLEFFKNKKKELGPIYVYALKLEHGKWYVGKTSHLKRRISQMEEGGNTWTKMHKVLNVDQVFENGDVKQITLDYMRKYGWENVRGYAWSQWNMKYPPKELRS
jgi:ssDNA-binding Zn-finger/Zn-ribbon topoisomerase 1/predicted GIY-YIG superfamily endonuclease